MSCVNHSVCRAGRPADGVLLVKVKQGRTVGSKLVLVNVWVRNAIVSYPSPNDLTYLHERLGGQVENHGVVRGQRHAQAALEEAVEGRVLQLQEEKVVAGRRHVHPDLVQVKQVLQRAVAG